MTTTPAFAPTQDAALALLEAVRPAAYARTRNHLDGAVTHLSPYLTHGLLTLPQVLQHLRQRHRLETGHKLVQELAWRAFFHHAWLHDGEAIFGSLHPGPLPDSAYARTLPEDIRRGATGVPVVDMAVRQLYATGYLHNHARMWLASYVVHLRKVHWRAGADWLYGHLLDGDLASNHLSWQWVAGTGSHKPYLFNAENVARFAPQPWHSADTPVDTRYEALDDLARSPRSVPVEGGPGVDEPPLHHTPPAGVMAGLVAADADAPPWPAAPWLLHPWALRAPPDEATPVGALSAEFHARWPWSTRRWQFVAGAMAALGATPRWLPGTAPTQALCIADLHLPANWAAAARIAAPQLFSEPGRRCRSFSQYFSRVAGSVRC